MGVDTELLNRANTGSHTAGAPAAEQEKSTWESMPAASKVCDALVRPSFVGLRGLVLVQRLGAPAEGEDLFSGIGGFAVAFAKFARTIGYCDNEPASRGVLERKIESGELDDAPIFEDVKKLHPKDLPPCENGWDAVDLVTAGFPCQDISCAGLHAGLAKGTRSSLVKQVVRLIRELGGGGAKATRKNVQNGANKNVATGNIPSYVSRTFLASRASPPSTWACCLP
ncbi:unnamed protein product [Prorocentrum cordatum]|uniref:DNA (cytosine-5-)-methyltransferase n=1 Tax=Prorocentrum cordatum TaxID=2364126 RepID=A0ABN9S855_9DINO|nr:unnamed protein product [Polarella glacialis]